MALFDFLKKKEFEEIERLKKEVANLVKYQGIVDVDKLIQERLDTLEDVKNNSIKVKAQIEEEIVLLRKNYSDAYEIYKKLKKQSDILTETIELSEYGLYEPHFAYFSRKVYQ